MSSSRHRDPAGDASQRLTFAIALGWGVGSLGMSAVFQAFSVLLLRFLTDYVGIAATAAGLLIGASKLVDAASDPLIGALSDRTRSRWGRRRPYLLVGGVVCAAGFFLMFNVTAARSAFVRMFLVEGALLVFAAGYALFNVPYLAMPAEMSTAPHERTYLISFRVTAVALGSLFGSFVAPWLISIGHGGTQGHRLMASGVAGLALVTSVACFAMTSTARFTIQGGRSEHGFVSQFRLAIQNKPFTSLVMVKLAQLLSVGATFAVTPYLFVEILKTGYAAMGLYFLAYFAAMVAGQPFFVWLCRRIGKKVVYLWTIPIVIAITLSWLLAGPGQPLAFTLIRGVALGFLSGSTLLVVQGMLPDTIHYDRLRTGLNREGVFAGVFITVEKLSGALSASLVGIFLGAAGYVASTSGATVQPASALRAIYLTATVVPALLLALSYVLMFRYHLPEATLLDNGSGLEPPGAATLLVVQPDIIARTP